MRIVLIAAVVVPAAMAWRPVRRLNHGPTYDVEELAVAASRAQNASSDGSIVVLTASRDYTPVLVNWLIFAERLGVRNWIVVCFDRAIRSFLEKRGVVTCVGCYMEPARPRETQKAKRERHRRIWTLRVQMLSDLVSRGISVTLSDLDAIWHRDATPKLAAADVVASRGSFPPWASDLWGAAACMGLVRFNSNQRTRLFVQEHLLPTAADLGDDQIALNAALKNVQIRWKNSNQPAFRNLTYVGSATTDYGETATGLTIALLPHTEFVRRCDLEKIKPDPASALVVQHCYTPKTVASKRTSLLSLGSWYLGDHWDIIPPDHNLQPPAMFSAWLNAVARPSPPRR
ncbi:hypothetical protein CTAYLR_009616 [Chrysophaeum taylorii]|uniref:Nucleotide-diphospho-sugar transferase domain-containing protein n=1 Tax=Chrysophaeum taylorii TaxID=2483200 RepID=A0AAD7XQJ7_9STRA|nr:hypothetical protein CTAYLR_009616 [Chrysophaeum taylorii]